MGAGLGKYLSALLLLPFLLAGCHSLPRDHGKPLRESLHAVMPPLVTGKLPALQTGYGDFQAYWDRFGGQAPSFPWAWSLLGPPGEDLGVLVIPPSTATAPQGVVVFFHGYLSHCGNFLELFRFLREEGWWVVAADLPGHGLSGPEERGGISSFPDYGNAAGRVVDWAGSLPEWKNLTLVGLGHSTGASSLLAFHQTRPEAFDQIILSAPLIRSWMYGPSDAASWLFRPLVSYLPSAESGDPLGVPYVPLRWFRALSDWNREIPNFKPLPIPLLLLTGNRDQVVETDYNIAQVMRIYPQHKLVVLDGLDHAVLQDGRYRGRVFGEIGIFLRRNSVK